MENQYRELDKLVSQLKRSERTITLMLEVIDWLDEETKSHIINRAAKERIEVQMRIEAFKTGKKFDSFLNERDKSILGKPSAGIRVNGPEPCQP